MRNLRASAEGETIQTRSTRESSSRAQGGASITAGQEDDSA